MGGGLLRRSVEFFQSAHNCGFEGTRGLHLARPGQLQCQSYKLLMELPRFLVPFQLFVQMTALLGGGESVHVTMDQFHKSVVNHRSELLFGS